LPGSILEMDDIKTTIVPLTVFDDTNTTQIATAGDDGDVADFELDRVDDLSGLERQLDCVVLLQCWVWVPNCPSVMCHKEWDALSANVDLCDLCQLELSFFLGDSVNAETTLGVEHQTEVLVGLLDRNNILETSRVVDVSSDFVVNLDDSLIYDHDDFTPCECILESVSQEYDEWEGFASFMGTR